MSRRSRARGVDTDHECQQLRLGSWLHSKSAAYNADLGETATLIREPCTEGTRVDILERIYSWALNPSSESPPVFWLTGQAGSGKSTIAYTVADHFDDVDDASSDLKYILGANFFCSRQFEETRHRKYIIPTIAYQLARQSGSYADALLRVNKPDSIDVITKQMKDLLVGPWQQSGSRRSRELRPYLIVIDALDEIEDNGGSGFLEELLKAISQGHLRGLKFLVTSRPDPDLAALCSSFNSNVVCRLYEVPTDTVKDDIMKYLRVMLPALQDPQLATLSLKADGLFIYAATAVRYILLRHRMTTDEQLRRLAELVDHMSSSADTPLLIDKLYQQILWGAFCKLPDAMFRDRLRILHTLLCTEERVSTAVAGILTDVVDAEMAKVVVEELHAVLYMKDNQVFWYHASFPDFMFAQERSRFSVLQVTGSRVVDMSCNEPAQHARLTHTCFRIMKSSLRFNICNLPSSFLLDSEVPDLNDRIEKNISHVLQYSCQNWAQHLNRAGSGDCDSLQTGINEFLRVRVLFWIEAMNLLGSRAQCSLMLQKSREWVLKVGDLMLSNRLEPIPVYQVNDKMSLELTPHLAEAANFSTYFGASPASQSTPHLYISSLTTWSRESTMCQMWKSQFSRGPSFKLTRGDHTVPLLTLQHEDWVRSVAFSSDGIRIVSSSQDQSVRVWDASTGAELTTLNGHTSWVNSVAFSGDGTHIVSGSQDQSVRVWDASTGAELTTLNGHTSGVNSVAFSSDGTRIGSGSGDQSVRVWDASAGAELTTLNGHTASVTSVAFSSDGTRIVSSSFDQSVRVWDASTGAELMTLNGHTSGVTSVAFSSDGTRIVSGAFDPPVRVWDASTGAELTTLNGHTGGVTSIAFSSDGTRIVSGAFDPSVRVWDASTGAELTTLNGHTSGLNSVAFSSDGTRIISGSFDQSVRVWDASMGTEMTGSEMTGLNGHTEWVNSVAFSSDRTRIVSGSFDQSVRVWDASTGTELKTLNGHATGVNSVAFSSDGTRIVSGSEDQSVRVWDASTGAELTTLNGHTGGDSSVSFSSDGTRIVSGAFDLSVRVWDALTGAELMALNGHTGWVNSVAFSGDGTHIVSGSQDLSVRVWDASTGAELTALNGHTSDVNSVAFSSDGIRIVSGSVDRSVRVWDVSTCAELMTLNGHTVRSYSVKASSDGTPVVSGFDDSIPAWNMAQHQHRWIVTLDNWIVWLPHRKRLMFVPPDIRGVLHCPDNPLIISRAGSATVAFVYSHIGTEWVGCYTLSVPI